MVKMEQRTETLICNSLEELPSIEAIKVIPRDRRYKIIFGEEIRSTREKIGLLWKQELSDFQVGIHQIESEINISKLISDEEIILNQAFFEQCAKDYRSLATKLITELTFLLKIEIKDKSPYESFSKFRGKNGFLNEWRYYFHGFHCCFEHSKTGQYIEVPLTYGLEFGELDPYFFMGYIKSTIQYQPLPIAIYNDYADGKKVIEKMVELGKFEIINSNIKNINGFVVKDRDKVKVEIYEFEEVLKTK